MLCMGRHGGIGREMGVGEPSKRRNRELYSFVIVSSGPPPSSCTLPSAYPTASPTKLLMPL